MSLRATVSAAALVAAATGLAAPARAQTANITPANANVLNLLSPFLQLNATSVGQSTLSLNLSQAIAQNAGASLTQQQLAISDKNLLGSATNNLSSVGLGTYGAAANLAGGLPAQTPINGVTPQQPVGGFGPVLGPIFVTGVANGTNGPLGATVRLLANAYNFTSSDLGVAKNYFANGAATNPSTTPANYTPVPAVAPAGSTVPTFNGLPNTTTSVYDLAYGVRNTDPGQDVYGSSRPIQVAQSRYNLFDPTALVGIATNPSFPSGHTNYAYTDSILLGILAPQLYQSMLVRASEYGDSRIVLGVHYPLDIIASRAFASYDIAQGLTNPLYINNAATTGTAINLPALVNAAAPELQAYLAAQCGGTVASCATSAANTANNPYVPSAANQALYQSRLTYGLPTLTYAQAPREAAPAGGPDASILLATVYGGSTAAALALAPNGGSQGKLSTGTINQIVVNTEGNALAAFYGTSLSYWSRIDLYSAIGYFQNVTGTITLASGDQVTVPVTIGSGGVLGGLGTVGSTTVRAGGALAPGALGGVGTLNVAGSLTFAPGSFYNVAVTPGAAAQTVVTGAATLNGATLVMTPTAGVYSPNARFRVLSAAGGLSGAFGATSTAAFFSPTVGYDATGAFLNVGLNYGAAAATGNQAAIAGGLNASAGAGVGGPVAAGLSTVGAGQGGAALDALSGEGVAASQNAALRAGQTFSSTLSDQSAVWRAGEANDPNGITIGGVPAAALGYARQPVRKGPIVVKGPAPVVLPPPRTWRAWAVGFGGEQRLSGVAALGTASQRSSFYGGAAGLDYQIMPSWLVGVAAGGSDASWSTQARSTSGQTTGFHVGAYTSAKFFDGFYAHASAAVSGFSNTETRYTGGFGGLAAERQTGSFGSFEYRLRGELGYSYTGFGPVGVTPFGAIEVARLRTNGFAETGVSGAGGPGLLGLAVQGKTTSSTPTFLGVKLASRFAVAEGWSVIPTLSAAWVHEFSPVRSLTTGLIVLPTTFTIDGARPARDSAQVKAGATLASVNGVSLFASFDGEFSDVSRIYAGKGGVRISW